MMSEEDLSTEEDDDLGIESEGGMSLSVADENDDEITDGDDTVMSDSAIVAKEKERARIQAEIEEFLSRGGQITTVESNVMTDPPRRPASNYGGQPI